MIFRTLLVTSAILALTTAEAAANGSRGQGSMVPTRVVTTQTTTSYNYTTRINAQPSRNMATASMLGLTRYKIGDTVWIDDGPTLWEEIQDLGHPAPPGFRYIHEDHVVLVVDRNRRVVDILRKN